MLSFVWLGGGNSRRCVCRYGRRSRCQAARLEDVGYSATWLVVGVGMRKWMRAGDAGRCRGRVSLLDLDARSVVLWRHVQPIRHVKLQILTMPGLLLGGRCR